MATTTTTSSSGGAGLFTIVFVVLLVLKLTDTIDWSWWWVTAPLWGPIAFALGAAIIGFAIWCIVVGVGKVLKIFKFRR